MARISGHGRKKNGYGACPPQLSREIPLDGTGDMSLMTSGLYYITEAEDDFGPCLVLQGSWSDDLMEVIEAESISVLRLSYMAGWKEKDVSFLAKLQDSGLRGVEIYAWDVRDITPMRHLTNLEYIGLQCALTKAPDFSQFKQLTHLFLFWRPQAKSVFDCSGLRLLNIVNYPTEDLQDLKALAGLRHLQITSRKLASLAGIEALRTLKTLDLAECPKLESLSGLEKCRELQAVELQNCKKVRSVSTLGALEGLRKVVLTDCGTIESLRPLAKCRLLEDLFFIGDTNVEDGELTPLLEAPELKKMWFADRRHYSHTRDQVAAMLA